MPLTQVEVANEYYSALKAHSSYWANADIPAFIMQEMFTTLPDLDATSRSPSVSLSELH